MNLKNKLIFFTLLFLSVFLVVYLIAQIIIQEPLTDTLTNLANPPTSAAEALVLAYLENQPKKVDMLLARTCRDRIWHKGATEDVLIPPDQAMRDHTAKINGHCLEKIEDKTFFLMQVESKDPDGVRYMVHAGTKDVPGAAVLDLTMLKEEDGNWRCKQVIKLP